MRYTHIGGLQAVLYTITTTTTTIIIRVKFWSPPLQLYTSSLDRRPLY